MNTDLKKHLTVDSIVAPLLYLVLAFDGGTTKVLAPRLVGSMSSAHFSIDSSYSTLSIINPPGEGGTHRSCFRGMRLAFERRTIGTI